MTSMDISVAMGGRNKRFGIGKTFVTGLAKGITNDNKCVRFEDNVDNPKARKAPLKIQTPGLNVARMALGLATKLSIGTSENKVIINGAKCMKGLTGSPKAKTVKAKKKISKLAIPEWLKQWQKIAADPPPHEKETNNHPNTPKRKEKKNPRGTISSPNQKNATPKCKKKAKNVKNLVKEKEKERQKNGSRQSYDASPYIERNKSMNINEAFYQGNSLSSQ